MNVLKSVGLAFALSLAAAPGVQAQDGAYKGYMIGPDDTIQVIVYGQGEFNVTTRVKSDGTIVMPLIGIVKADGETNVTLARNITDKLVSGGFLKSPLVNVEIGAYVSRTVNVAGNVGTSGIYPLDRPYHALEVLLKAGWVRVDAASFVYFRRPGQPVRTLEVEQLVRGEKDSDPLLQPGDTLFVPPAETFFIYGAVGAAGMKAMLPNMSIRQAIALAGGVTQAGNANKAGLIRGNGKEMDVDPSQKVQNGDIIVIKERLF
ncbi:polysaccharide biosynthesis/export family protein [Sandarakinorhabdus sp.]|uniref:polysaccharide biosynthesis/export family protein n=1 Tax=Sandarakinorhabdus sp. TaxID=1916663 RepID=UPI0033401DD3